MKSKIDISTVKNFKTAFVAGILIGFGVIINTTITNSIIGSLFFSFGLLAIIALKLPLYTGKIGFWKDPTSFPIMLGANLAGTLCTIGCYIITKPEFITLLSEISKVKFEKTLLQMLFCGILCGALIHIAVKIKEVPITILSIAIFILIGAEHCIADFPFLIVNFNLINFLKWVIVIIGNSIGARFIELLTKETNNEICTNNSK